MLKDGAEIVGEIEEEPIQDCRKGFKNNLFNPITRLAKRWLIVKVLELVRRVSR